MFTTDFLRSAIERAIKTAAQALLLAVGASTGADLFHLDWANAAGAVIAGFAVSLLTSIVSAPFGPKGSPSLVTVSDSTTPAPAPAIGSDQTPVV